VVVLGASNDTVEAQKKFAEKFDLKFPLLADSKTEVIDAYGVGGLTGFADRKTFVIDSKGKIAKIYHKVNPLTHAATVLQDLASVS